MIPEIADQLNEVGLDADTEGRPMDASDVVRAIARGARAAGLEVLNMEELDDIASEMSGPPWPA